MTAPTPRLTCATCDGSGILTVPDTDGESASRQACPDPVHEDPFGGHEFDYENPPAEITVTVTADDIRLGEPGSALRDPICRAVCRFLGVPVSDNMSGARVSIDASGLDIWPGTSNEPATYQLPDEAVKFLETFDITGSGDPVTFTARLLDGA